MKKTEWTFNEKTREWIDQYGARYSENKKTIVKCLNSFKGHFYIPDCVECIGDGAFCGCYNLETITIPDSVIRIGDAAFKDCAKLEQINIPKSVTRIGEAAFMACANLKDITIPNSVTRIED